MGLMSPTSPRKAYALGLVVAIALLSVIGAAPFVRATPAPIEPAAAMTVTLVPNQGGYLNGDVASVNAMVYRTPGPANYTYNWTVRDNSGRLLNTTVNGGPTFRYSIPLNYTGPRLTFFVRVDDGQGLASNAQSTVTVSVAVMSLRLDRGDFAPGDAITASYSVTSHVILRPTYDYQVADSSLTIVLSGNTNNTTFSFRTPAPASRTYRFLVTASAGTNTSQAQLTIAHAAGWVLGETFDRASYTPGDSIHAHLAVTPRSTAALPLQFTWTLSLGLGFGGSPTVSAITTVPEGDLSLPIPAGVGTGELVVIATESSTGTAIGHTLHIGTTNALWSTDIGGVPLFAVLLGLLFILLLVAVLW